MFVTAFVDFRTTFDCVSHGTLLHKLKQKFGIEGNFLSWLTDYLNHPTQVTVVNSTQSEELNVTCSIPQGLVLGPCLFSLYTNDMPESVTSGTLYLYPDDTTIYCIGSAVDDACSLLNNALDKLNKWSMTNSLTLTWSKHLTDLKNNFVNELNLLKKCSFLKRKSPLDLYFNMILPSVT